MKMIGAAVCSEVERTNAGLDLKGVFTEINRDPVPDRIKCDLVIALEREPDETKGEKRTLRVDLIHRESGQYIEVGGGAAVVPEISATIILKGGNLRLKGPGTYDIRVVDVTDSSREVALASQPLFVVRVRADAGVEVA